MPSPGQNEWESYNMYPPQRTPPFQVPGWNSPYGRGGSPALPHMLINSGMNGSYAPVLENNSVLSPTVSDLAMPENMFQNGAQLFAERLQQQHQQVRRGSPLAHVREVSVEESEPVLPRNKFVVEPQPEIVGENQGPTIVEPVPKHRRNEPSISLQREMQGVEKEENMAEKHEVHKEEFEDGVNNSEFVTNPVSPALPNYLNQSGDTLRFPDQPEMPNLETDVHIGAELASNPDDDVTDPETEANERKEAAMGGDNSINNKQPLMPLQDAKPLNQYYNQHGRDSSQHLPPSNHFLNSRTPADSLQAQLQHDYDSPDPIQHSAMAMLIAGDDLHPNGVLGSLVMGDEHLSEDARTNPSDILTNPSVPNSPRRKFSVTAADQHAHHLSNGSNRSGWAVMDQPGIPKTHAPEFKYDPTATFMFSPSNFKSVSPQPPPNDTSIGGFGAPSFNVAAPSFTPGGTFNFKATSFDPAVPSFTPSYTTPSFPPEIVKPPPVKKAIPIVRPPSRKEEQRAAEEEADPRDPKSQEGGRKRTRHELVLEEDKVDEQDLKDKVLLMPIIGDKGEVKELAHREDMEIENKEESQLEGLVEKSELRVELEKGADAGAEPGLEQQEGKQGHGVAEQEEGEMSGGLSDDIDEVSSDEEAEALMEKSPTDLIQDFNPYEFKKMSEMEEFANARPSTTFDHARGKSNRTPDTAEDGSLPDLSVDEASFAIAHSSLLQDQGPSPPPLEAQPPPPPVGRRTSIFGGNSFSFEFKGAESKALVPHLQQPLTPKATGMAASIYAYTPSPPHTSSPAAPPSILSPALSNPYSPTASPPQEEEEEEEAEDKKLKPRSLRSKSLKKRLQLSDQELDEIVNTINDMDPPYLSRRPSEEGLHEHHDEDEETEPITTDEEEEVVEDEEQDEEQDEEGHGLEDDEDDPEEPAEEDAVPWKPRAKPKRPALDGVFKAPPVPPYGGLHPDEPRRSAAPSPMPKHYRHRAASFSADEVREPVRPAVSSYKPPELPLLEKYRSTAIGITTKVDSDWDDMISEGDNTKLHPQSRMFFDAHVEELVGALLKAHVDPLEKSLVTIQEALAGLSTAQIASQSRRKFSTHSAESDADDEDDGEEDGVRPPSAKRDPKLEKIKAAVLEVLSSANLAVNTPVQKGKDAPTPVPQLNGELQSTILKATKGLEKKLDNNRTEVEDAMKEFQAVLEQGQSGNTQMLMQMLHGLEDTLDKRENIILKSTKDLEDRLNENLNTRSKALEELSEIIERRQSGSMTVITQTLNGLEEAVNAKDNIIVNATKSLENKLNEVVKSNNLALDEVNNTVSTQLETVDESIQATRKDIEEKAYWLGRKLAEATHKLERGVVERQDNVEVAKALEQKLLDYTLITIENNKALESNLFRKSDAVLETTRALQSQFDNTHSRQDVMSAETRSIAQRIVEVTKSLEGKMQDRDKVIYDATKNLENRLYERGIAMVMDARQFVEDKFKERDVVLLNVTKTLNDKLQNRDSSVIADLGRSLDERLQERDRAVMEATRRLEEKFEQQDISAIVEVTKSLEDKLSERDAQFAQATSHLAEKLDIRDISVAEDVMIAFAERLKERDEAVVEDAMKAFDGRLNRNQQDMTDTRKQIERLINRDHEGLVELTQGLEDALKQRDIAMSAEAAAAFQSLEERVMERENNDSLIQELRAAVEEILDKQRRLLEDGHKRVGGVEMEELQKRQGVLESLLEESRSTVKTEADLRREAQQKVVELETGFRLAEEERDRQKELAQETERRLKSSDEKRQQALSQAQIRSALLEGAHSSLQKSVSDLSARNAVLEGSLHEAKAAGERLREDNGMAQNENRELRRTIETLKSGMEESIRVREGFRGKFNKLQEDMRSAQTEINREQARAARRDEEQKARIEVLEARLAAEAKSKEWFEKEVERLRAEEREAIRLKVELEHVKRHADKTEELSDRLRAENLEQQRNMVILQVDVENARQFSRDEVGRASITVQRDIEAANNQVNMVRASLEKQLQDTRHEADRMRNAALQEQHRKYELQLVDIRSHHERTLANAREDADRSQATLRQNLGIANNQIEHLKERTAHLEDKLSVATSAAQAAAQAAQTAKTSPNGGSRGSVTGEKVSSQALRESIVALQEQLGEREARVEELEQKLAAVEKETSKKLKDSDFEVSWLRELLTVRVNELEEITKALQSPTFDREIVRGAAVRLKANLQMEQQVRERGINGTAAELGSSVVANVTELAKQLPLAAAWGSWRGIRGKAKEESQTSPARSPAAQPTAPATSQSGFLSGFLTPPNMAGATSKLASRLPDIGSVNFSSKKPRSALDLSEYGGSPAVSAVGVRRDAGGRHMSQEAVAGATPQSLMRRGSYDDDADVSVLGMGLYGDGGSVGHEDFGVGDDVPPFRTAACFSG